MGSKARKLNTLEQKIHQALLSAPDGVLHQKQIDALEPNAAKIVDAINFLSATGLLRVRTDAEGGLSYRAVGKKEVEVKKGLSGEESMVLSHIQAAGTEGIWTKHLKTKTELHQTVIDRCLKSLVQKQLIKSITNVKYPTRKTYMMAHLEPSSSITGGPWYTDNELDTEFIKLLMGACLKFIREKTFPKAKSDQPLLYPISTAPDYPTTQQVQNFLQKSRITETQLSLEHVEMLLNVLVIDGEIERVPAFGTALWESKMRDDSEDESESDRRQHRRKREKGERDSKRRHFNPRSHSHSASGSDSEESDARSRKRRRKHERSQGRKDSGDKSRSGSDSEEESGRLSRKSKSKGKSKSRGKNKVVDIESEKERERMGMLMVEGDEFGGAYVYRAIRQEHVALGWSQAPCGRCPQFSFCKDGGPVNPRECEYYGEWLNQVEVPIE